MPLCVWRSDPIRGIGKRGSPGNGSYTSSYIDFQGIKPMSFLERTPGTGPVGGIVWDISVFTVLLAPTYLIREGIWTL